MISSRAAVSSCTTSVGSLAKRAACLRNRPNSTPPGLQSTSQTATSSIASSERTRTSQTVDLPDPVTPATQDVLTEQVDPHHLSLLVDAERHRIGDAARSRTRPGDRPLERILRQHPQLHQVRGRGIGLDPHPTDPRLEEASRFEARRWTSAAVRPPASLTWTVRPILSRSTLVTVEPFKTGVRAGLASIIAGQSRASWSDGAGAERCGGRTTFTVASATVAASTGQAISGTSNTKASAAASASPPASCQRSGKR